MPNGRREEIIIVCETHVSSLCRPVCGARGTMLARNPRGINCHANLRGPAREGKTSYVPRRIGLDILSYAVDFAHVVVHFELKDENTYCAVN